MVVPFLSVLSFAQAKRNPLKPRLQGKATGISNPPISNCNTTKPGLLGQNNCKQLLHKLEEKELQFCLGIQCTTFVGHLEAEQPYKQISPPGWANIRILVVMVKKHFKCVNGLYPRTGLLATPMYVEDHGKGPYSFPGST